MIGLPPSSRKDLAPPPMRLDLPPASSRPMTLSFELIPEM
jgi:hypothetical protein